MCGRLRLIIDFEMLCPEADNLCSEPLRRAHGLGHTRVPNFFCGRNHDTRRPLAMPGIASDETLRPDKEREGRVTRPHKGTLIAPERREIG